MRVFRAGIFAFLLLFSGVSPLAAEGLNWTPMDKAFEAARTAKKKVYYYFYSPGCSWCQTMTKKTLATPEVISYLNAHFVSVKINVTRAKDLVRRFELKTVPGSVFLSSEDTVLLNQPGYFTPEDFLEVLEGVQDGGASGAKNSPTPEEE